MGDPGAKEKVEDGSKNNDVVDLSDTDKRSFQVLWEIFTICYEGYFGFTISTLLCLFRAPETRPLFAYSLFALYLYKAKAFFTTFTTDKGKQNLPPFCSSIGHAMVDTAFFISLKCLV